jgi:simple sugar transport system ATP-binding protein
MSADRTETPVNGTTPRLALTGITKIYPSVIANEDVDLTVMPGEIHAVLGENGAGKSTLMKMIYGVVRPDRGEMRWEGHPVVVANPAHARELGIGMVFQHFSLFETLTVVENVALALPGTPELSELAERIRQVSDKYGLPVDPRRIVHSLSVGERQRVEITRCLLQTPKLLIMDEPTSVLTPQAVRNCSRRCASSRPKAADSLHQPQARRDSGAPPHGDGTAGGRSPGTAFLRRSRRSRWRAS